jgi:hypothetical protein
MLKERAASALKHGLPVPTPPPVRARASDAPRSGSTSRPAARSQELAPPNRVMPLAVKLLAGGLLLLGIVYGLTLFRDHRASTEAVESPAETDSPGAAASSPPTSAVVGSDSPGTNARNVLTPAAQSAAAESSPSADPSPLAASLRAPSAQPPEAPRAATQPTSAAPIAQKKPIQAVNAGAAVGSANASQSTVPAARAPVSAPTPVPRKADNPY